MKELLQIVHENEKRISRDFKVVSNNIKEIVINDVCYEVEEIGSTRALLSVSDNTFIFSQFFQKGWKPKSIGKVNLENCFICTVLFKGKFNKMPNFGDNPNILFKNRDSSRQELIEQPITLEIGKAYDDKIQFKIKETGEEHWIYINGVSICDIFAETMKNFENPKIKGQRSEKELQKMKADTEKRLMEVCPKGKGFLSIEYESDTDEQIDFHSIDWLESEPIHRTGAISLIASPNYPTGKLGKPLRVALVEEPLDLSTKSMEVELFCLIRKIENSDIELTSQLKT